MELESEGQGLVNGREQIAPGPSVQNLPAEVFRQHDLYERQNRLAEIIREEIVPRLQLLHHNLHRSQESVALRLQEIAEFGALAIGPDDVAMTVYFERMRAKGHSLEALFADFLAPTARHLGELWEQDRCDFVDVTLGVARLQQVLAAFGSAEDIHPHDVRQRALLISAPAEKHLFGVEMVAKFMRAAGWDIWVEKGLHASRYRDAVATEWFAVVGVTLSTDSGADDVARIIEGVRRASMNRDISIMVGGPAFADNPALVAQVGADAAAADAPTAVILAKRLLLLRAAKT